MHKPEVQIGNSGLEQSEERVLFEIDNQVWNGQIVGVSTF
jgi:RNA-binding protein YhbY